MAPKIGDALPHVKLTWKEEDNFTTIAELSKGKRVVIFAVPGAFTPTCHKQHLPGYLEDYDAIKALGVEHIICIATNDVYVVNSWGEAHNVGDKIVLLADPAAAYTKALGEDLLIIDHPALGSARSKRYAMIVEDNIIKTFDLEPPGAFECSRSTSILKQLAELNKK